MWEKIGAALVLIVSIPSMVFIKGLGLPAFITIPLIVAFSILYLFGLVFLFSQERIIKWPQRVKTLSRVSQKDLSLERL
jgi:cell division protein FtsW (lipid II flippase)